MWKNNRSQTHFRLTKITLCHVLAHHRTVSQSDTFVKKRGKTPQFFHIKIYEVMRMLTAFLVFLTFLIVGCTSKQDADAAAKKSPSPIDAAAKQSETHGTEIKEVNLTNPLNADWIATGKGIYEVKCLACHKLTGEKLVGPGWAGITKKRQPVWIMNMITNVEMMLEKDEEAQKLLEACLVRMPNQNISQEDARKILEFMRSNDGEK